MTKRMIAMVAMTCMLVALLAACGNNGMISTAKAEKIVLKDLGVSASKADVDVHTGQYDGKPCYAVYVTVDGHHWQYLVDVQTGEILSAKETDQGHSH